MIRYTLLLSLFALSAKHWSANALQKEKVLGGFDADQQYSKFHVIVLVKPSPNSRFEVACNAGLIRENLALSIATCFIDSDGNMKPQSFYAAAGTKDVSTDDGVILWISKIYVPQFNSIDELINLSVLLLNGYVSFEPSEPYSQLFLPMMENQFDRSTAFWYGCECEEGLDDLSLKFTQLRIMPDSEIQQLLPDLYEDLNAVKQRVARFTMSRFGFCDTDTGSPLVVGSRVVGVATEAFADGDTLTDMILYTDTFANAHFIQHAMQDEVNPRYVRAYDNHYFG